MIEREVQPFEVVRVREWLVLHVQRELRNLDLGFGQPPEDHLEDLIRHDSPLLRQHRSTVGADQASGRTHRRGLDLDNTAHVSLP